MKFHAAWRKLQTAPSAVRQSLLQNVSKRRFRVDDVSDVMTYIRTNTVVTNQSLTPEISLHLVTPECTLWTAREEECLVPDPFWAFYWPGGQAVSRYILDNKTTFAGKRIIDIGSGCGASAIAATMIGAETVTANDICKVAAISIQMNSDLNGAHLNISTDNIIGTSLDSCDIVILGDMFYDPAFTTILHDWLSLIHLKGVEVLIGDPGRVYLLNHPIKSRLRLLEKYALLSQTCSENNGFSDGYVWKFT